MADSPPLIPLIPHTRHTCPTPKEISTWNGVTAVGAQVDLLHIIMKHVKDLKTLSACNKVDRDWNEVPTRYLWRKCSTRMLETLIGLPEECQKELSQRIRALRLYRASNLDFPRLEKFNLRSLNKLSLLESMYRWQADIFTEEMLTCLSPHCGNLTVLRVTKSTICIPVIEGNRVAARFSQNF